MTTYRSGSEQLDAFLAAEGLTNLAEVRRRYVEGFIAHLVETRSAATAHVSYRSLQQLFNWLVDEEEIDRSPMSRMKPPIIPEEPVEVVSDEDLRRLLKPVEGRDFVSRRDNGAIRLWLDTGMRRGELGNLACSIST